MKIQDLRKGSHIYEDTEEYIAISIKASCKTDQVKKKKKNNTYAVKKNLRTKKVERKERKKIRF